MLDVRITKQLRDFTLDIQFNVDRGSILVLMGSNGSGKSTTLNSISGLVIPDAGRIRLDNLDFYNSSENIDVSVEDRRIGYVFQNCAVFPHLTVRDNVRYGLKALHENPKETDRLVQYWMDRMRISDIAHVTAGHLSGGQKQRVALARAFAIRPSLLMLDEPFTALDAGSMETAKDLIRSNVHDLNIPCILVTHRPVDARDMSRTAILLSQGKISWTGNPEDLPDNMKNCTCPEVR